MIFNKNLHKKKLIIIKKKKFFDIIICKLLNVLKFSAIDIGSHNCKMVIVEIKDNKFKNLHFFSKQLNLGKELIFNSEFSQQKVNDLVKFFKKISFKLNQFKVNDYRCIATEAFRKSINSKKTIDIIKFETGIKIEVISSAEEAKLCVQSCKKKILEDNIPKLIFDIGGGSTELIFIKDEKFYNNFKFVSLPYGVVNLNEHFDIYSEKKTQTLISKDISIFYEKNFQDLDMFNAIGCCRTTNIICCEFNKLKKFNKNLVNKTQMTFEQVCKINSQISKKQQNLNCYNNSVDNPNLLLNGVFILNEIMKIFKFNVINFSSNGLVDGLVFNFLSNK